MDQEQLKSQIVEEIRSNLLAGIGKWSVGIITTIIATTWFASMQWNSLNVRVDRIENKYVPVEEFYKMKEEQAQRYADLNAKMNQVIEILKNGK